MLDVVNDIRSGLDSPLVVLAIYAFPVSTPNEALGRCVVGAVVPGSYAAGHVMRL